MADDGKITLEAVLDTTKIERGIKEMQDKIEKMKRSSSEGSFGQFTGSQNQNDLRIKRMEDIRKRENKRDREIILKDLVKQQQELDKHVQKYEKITKLQENLNKNGKAYQKSLEKQAEAFEKMSRSADAINKGRSALYGEGVGPFDGRQTEFIKRSFQGGGVRRGMGAIGRTVSQMPVGQKVGMIGAGMMATGSAIQGLGEIGFQLGTRDERRAGYGAQVAGMLGEAANLQMNRRGYEMELYRPERMRALDRAFNRKQFSQAKDVTDATGGTLSTLGSAAGYGAAGAAIGSVIPGVGTAIGGVVGAGYGLYKSSRSMKAGLMNDTAREGMGSFLGIDDSEDFYEKIKSGEAAEVYKKQLANEKAMSYEKTNAQEYFMKNRGRIQALQRGFGMSDEDLFKGEESLFQRGTRAGFMTDTIERNMQAIGAAGGTSQMAQDGAIMASQMERGLNLTNAGSLLGRMSGMGMDKDESKDAIIRMYSEATRLGLDGSEFAKETRTFLDTAANMSYQSGASAQNVAGLLGMGTNMLTDRGIKASQDALQSLMGKTGQMGGLTGQYQLAALTSDKMNKLLGGKEFNEKELAMLSGMDITKISEEDEYIQTIMERRGIKPGSDEAKELIQALRSDVKVDSTLRSPEQKRALEKLGRFNKQLEKDPELAKDPEFQKKMREARSSARELGAITEGEEFSRKDVFQQKSYVDLMSRLQSGDISQKDFTKKFEEMMKKDTKKLTDEAEGAMSADDRGNLKNLTKYSGDLSESFKKTNDSVIQFRMLMEGLVESMKAGNPELFKQYQQRMNEFNQRQIDGNTNFVEQGAGTGDNGSGLFEERNFVEQNNGLFGNNN